jgi:class 3 adenylate cyclase
LFRQRRFLQFLIGIEVEKCRRRGSPRWAIFTTEGEFRTSLRALRIHASAAFRTASRFTLCLEPGRNRRRPLCNRRSPIAAQASPVTGERRQFTILFADLAGFTKLSGRSGC